MQKSYLNDFIHSEASKTENKTTEPTTTEIAEETSDVENEKIASDTETQTLEIGEKIQYISPESDETKIQIAEYINYDDKADDKETKVDNQEIEVVSEEAKTDDQEIEVVAEEAKTDDQEIEVVTEEAKIDNQEIEVVTEEAKIDNQEIEVVTEEAKADDQEIEEVAEEAKADDQEIEVVTEEAKADDQEIEVVDGEEITPGLGVTYSDILEEEPSDTFEEETYDDDSYTDEYEDVTPSEEELADEAVDFEEEQAPKKKQSIFKRALNAVKNVVCHPIKTLKTVVVTTAKVVALPFIGIGYFISHPVKSVKNIFNTITHPIKKHRNLKNANEENNDLEISKLTDEELEEYYDRTYVYTNLMLLEGELYIREDEKESSKTTMEEEPLTINNSASDEVNKNQSDLIGLDDLEAEEVLIREDDGVEIIHEEPLLKENDSFYNLDKENNKYTNMPIDASEIGVNNGSFKPYDTPENMFTANTYNNSTSEKPFIKVKY